MLGQQRNLQLPRLCWHRWVSSQYNGVYWNKARGKYHARVGFKGQHKHVGYFLTEQEAAHAYDLRLRGLCHDGIRLKRSLNFPTPLEASFKEDPQKSRRRALAVYSKNASKEDASFDRLRRLFMSSPQAETYEIIRVSESSKVDALFQPRGSLTGGLALQLKSASFRQQDYGYVFSRTRGYAGMLLVLLPLDGDALWALPGASVTQWHFFIKPGSSRDMALQVRDVGSLLEGCYRNRQDFPHLSLSEARLQCSPTHLVEEQAHALLTTLFSRIGCQLQKSFAGLATVDSVLVGEGGRWRVQEKASTLQARGYSANLWKCGGALGRLAYAETDFDLLLVSLLDDGQLAGLFAFPSDLLTNLGYLGQRACGLQLHPPWRLPKGEKTRVKYAWQLAYFVDLRKWDAETPQLPAEMRCVLGALLARLAEGQEKTRRSCALLLEGIARIVQEGRLILSTPHAKKISQPRKLTTRQKVKPPQAERKVEGLRTRSRARSRALNNEG